MSGAYQLEIINTDCNMVKCLNAIVLDDTLPLTIKVTKVLILQFYNLFMLIKRRTKCKHTPI